MYSKEPSLRRLKCIEEETGQRRCRCHSMSYPFLFLHPWVLLCLCGSVHYINQPSLKKGIKRLILHLSYISLWSWHTYKKSWVRIGKRFKEPRNRFHVIGSASLFVAWRASMTTLFVVPQEPRNRFLDTINAYKFGLWVSVMEVNAFCRFLCFRQLPRALLVTFYDINKE